MESTISTEEQKLKELKTESLLISPTKEVSYYDDITELKTVINNYFENSRRNAKYPTMTGLAMILGITRKELLNYKGKDPIITNIVQRAKQYISANVEELLISGNPASGLSLWLRNNDDWVEKTERVNKNITQAQILEQLDALEYEEDEEDSNTFSPVN